MMDLFRGYDAIANHCVINILDDDAVYNINYTGNTNLPVKAFKKMTIYNL